MKMRPATAEQQQTAEGLDLTENRGERILPFVNVEREAVLAYISAEQFTLAWPEIAAGAGMKQDKSRVARTNSPAHQLRRRGYRTIGEVCAAARVSDSTLIGWEGRFVPAMKKINGIRVLLAEQFETYVEQCIELKNSRSRKSS